MEFGCVADLKLRVVLDPWFLNKIYQIIIIIYVNLCINSVNWILIG